ncbi:unnamed protein product [Dovyalis caffra]|uniref:Uncharacterized protein n=1 Tax=Dovyalis caffra TaxID=77055 RepID=A0AAV1RSV5_9ROSI|nr:unnamed protein product [Dovyalis caffra]
MKSLGKHPLLSMQNIRDAFGRRAIFSCPICVASAGLQHQRTTLCTYNSNEQEEERDQNARKANKKPEPPPEAKPDVPETTANAEEPERSDSDESDDSI